MKPSLIRIAVTLATFLAIVVGSIAFGGQEEARAQTVNPSEADTARLLGYMWADGSFSNGVWDVNSPSGTRFLITELVERHGGTFVDSSNLTFRLPAPYDWVDWKDGLPDDNAAVRAAVESPHFLAAVLEGEGAVDGLVYDQSSCCVDGFTFGRLTELRQLLQRRGFQTAEIVPFNDPQSGAVTIGRSEFAELRATHRFACPQQQSNIRIPGGTDLAAHGDIRWLGSTTRWPSLVRTDCVEGQSVPSVTAPTGTCSVSANDTEARISWTFSLGDISIRRNGTFVKTVPAREGSTTDALGNGNQSYDMTVRLFGTSTVVSCGGVGAPAPAPAPTPTPGGITCTAKQGNGGIDLRWDDASRPRYEIRRNDAWLASVIGATSTTVPGSLNDSWEVRFRESGEIFDVPCTRDGAASPTCSADRVQNGIRVTWDNVAGVDTFQVRADNRWRAEVVGATSYLDRTGADAQGYVIRYRNSGSTFDINCS